MNSVWIATWTDNLRHRDIPLSVCHYRPLGDGYLGARRSCDLCIHVTPCVYAAQSRDGGSTRTGDSQHILDTLPSQGGGEGQV